MIVHEFVLYERRMVIRLAVCPENKKCLENGWI